MTNLLNFLRKHPVHFLHIGKTGGTAIREAFRALVTGGMGNIKFDDEDFFAEVDTDKVMASWTLNLQIDGKPLKMRGLDLLHFRGDKLVRKLAYCKGNPPVMTD